MNTRTIKAGTTDVSVIIRIIDDTDGTPENAVAHDTTGIDLWYRREGAAKTSITEAALSALTDAHSDGGLEPIDDGYYRLDLPDAACAVGAKGVMVGGHVDDMIVIGCYIELTHAATAQRPEGVIASGTVSSYTNATSITLATGLTIRAGSIIIATGGTGSGSSATVLSYTTGTGATVLFAPGFDAALDNTTTFEVYAGPNPQPINLDDDDNVIANIHFVNDVELEGDGSATPWGPA